MAGSFSWTPHLTVRQPFLCSLESTVASFPSFRPELPYCEEEVEYHKTTFVNRRMTWYVQFLITSFQCDLLAHWETPLLIDWISVSDKSSADAMCTGPGLTTSKEGNAHLGSTTVLPWLPIPRVLRSDHLHLCGFFRGSQWTMTISSTSFSKFYNSWLPVQFYLYPAYFAR